MDMKNGLLSVNIFDNLMNKIEYACHEHEKYEVIARLEKQKKNKKISDYEIYGFSAYTNKKEGVEYGDKVYIARCTGKQLTLNKE